ncbi:endolytic transglycosylase MltG [Arthrobacter sp. NPDC090010]|uniref:endolytic transglycosylase MltG n=1 Tax=Arthrobacter sp. NPDC090010 TaxID=3363942 RepID=UPI00381878D4
MSTENSGPTDSGVPQNEGMPLTRRELRARERMLAERREQERAARASAPFDQELEELPRGNPEKPAETRDTPAARQPAARDSEATPGLPQQSVPVSRPSEPAKGQPAEPHQLRRPRDVRRASEDQTEAPAVQPAAVQGPVPPASSAPLDEPRTARISPVPAASHAQHFYPAPEPGRLAPRAHGHKTATGQHPIVETRPGSTTEPQTAAAGTVTEEHHGLHEAAPDHSFHFLHSAEPEQEPVHPGKTAFHEESASPRKHRRLRGWIAVLLSLLLVGGGGFAAVQVIGPSLGWNRVTDFPGPGTGSVAIDVPEGSSVTQVANSLKDAGVVADAGTFTKAFAAAEVTLRPGKYTFKEGMRASDAVTVLSGGGNDKVSYVALSAGLRVNESLDAIAKGTGLALKDLQALNSKPAQFGVSTKAKNLEGYLFPGEYRFPLGATAKQVIAELVKGTQDELKSQGITDPDKQYQSLTIASIVQAEAGRADYPTVAGAIMNRLQHNPETLGYIQSDATVTYGLGRKSYELTAEEKADKSNLYNTYANPGLPVGPIGSPGKLAIDAAAHPKSSDYLYWVTINLDTGETRFAATLAEHNKNVQLYQNWCSANAGRCQ